MPAPAFYRAMLLAIGPWLLALFAAGCIAAMALRMRNMVAGLLLTCVALLGFAPLLPVHDPRHLLPVIGMMALAASITLDQGLRRLRWVAAAVEATLLIAVFAFAAKLPNYRSAFDVPALLTEAYQAIRENTPEGSLVLSLWTYDTAYYSERPATWPIAWGQHEPPYEPFVERDPKRLLAALERHRIDYVLMPHTQTHELFNGSNYNRSFIEGLNALLGDGRLVTIWRSSELALVGRPR